jgi:hypothetical protein
LQEFLAGQPDHGDVLAVSGAIHARPGALRSLFPEWVADLPDPPEPVEDATAVRQRLFRALLERLSRPAIVDDSAGGGGRPDVS